jgi:hypothetical protein
MRLTWSYAPPLLLGKKVAAKTSSRCIPRCSKKCSVTKHCYHVQCVSCYCQRSKVASMPMQQVWARQSWRPLLGRPPNYSLTSTPQQLQGCTSMGPEIKAVQVPQEVASPHGHASSEAWHPACQAACKLGAAPASYMPAITHAACLNPEKPHGSRASHGAANTAGHWSSALCAYDTVPHKHHYTPGSL